jgi:hypothetical protein
MIQNIQFCDEREPSRDFVKSEKNVSDIENSRECEKIREFARGYHEGYIDGYNVGYHSFAYNVNPSGLIGNCNKFSLGYIDGYSDGYSESKNDRQHDDESEQCDSQVSETNCDYYDGYRDGYRIRKHINDIHTMKSCSLEYIDGYYAGYENRECYEISDYYYNDDYDPPDYDSPYDDDSPDYNFPYDDDPPNYESEDECIVGKGGGICPCCGGIGDPSGRNAMRRMIFSDPQLMSQYFKERLNTTEKVAEKVKLV